jgi:hypothetical protein
MSYESVRARVHEIMQIAERFQILASMPDHVTRADIEQAVSALRDSALKISFLIEATPVGCTCPRTEREDRSTFIDRYDPECRHHGRLHALEERGNKLYEDTRQKLKNEVRIQLVAAALTGLLSWRPSLTTEQRLMIVDVAIASADMTIEKLLAPSIRESDGFVMVPETTEASK